MNLVKLFWVIISAILICAPGYAQAQNSIQCKLIDSKNGEAIPYASVRFISNHNFIDGLVSNLDGDFQFPKAYQSYIDSVVITCIGYAKLSIPISDFSENKISIIKIKQAAKQLGEVVVKARRSLSANDIINYAIKNISRNYSMKPFSYTAYYRDYQLEEKKYVNLNEAIIKVFDRGFNTNDFDSTTLQMVRYKENKTFPRDKTTSGNYNEKSGEKFIPKVHISSLGGNELSQLMIHDAIRNNQVVTYSFVDKLSKNFRINHIFKLIETVDLDGTSLFHIGIESTTRASDLTHLAKGDIYIEWGNYAIHKLVYKAFETGDSQPKLLYDIRCEYRRIGSTMYLNYISFNNMFVVKTSNGFNAVGADFDTNLNAFIVQFNHGAEHVSAAAKNNYTLLFDNKKVGIYKVEHSLFHPEKVMLYPEEKIVKLIKEDPKSLQTHLKLELDGVKDLAGREINKTVYKNVNQYREFFVQNLNQEISKENFTKLSKARSLKEQARDTVPSTQSYWMNSPLLKKD